jgi:hypothetical protein
MALNPGKNATNATMTMATKLRSRDPAVSSKNSAIVAARPSAVTVSLASGIPGTAIAPGLGSSDGADDIRNSL